MNATLEIPTYIREAGIVHLDPVTVLWLWLSAQGLTDIQRWPEIDPDALMANDPDHRTTLVFLAGDGLDAASEKLAQRRCDFEKNQELTANVNGLRRRVPRTLAVRLRCTLGRFVSRRVRNRP